MKRSAVATMVALAVLAALACGAGAGGIGSPPDVGADSPPSSEPGGDISRARPGLG
ncbi:MAG: hypothetical protein FJ087_23585 [Deltaproteobacteria bacterium]|nr:hypothetical protein [Deltaproteobacteria bacterium]